MLKPASVTTVCCSLLLLLTSCGAGVITSEDVSPGQGVVIALIVIAAALYVLAVGLRK